MMPLEMVGLGGSLSKLLLPHLNGKTSVREGILVGGNGDGGRKLRPDNGGARTLAVDTRRRHGSRCP